MIKTNYIRPNFLRPLGHASTSFRIAAATDMLRSQIAPRRCDSRPATRTPSALREQLIQHTCTTSSADACYTCARPVILSIRRTILGAGSDQQVLFADLRSIATGKPSALPPSDPTQTPQIPVAIGCPNRVPAYPHRWPYRPHHRLCTPPPGTGPRASVLRPARTTKQATTTIHSDNHYRNL